MNAYVQTKSAIMTTASKSDAVTVNGIQLKAIIKKHLSFLIAQNTCNPPRSILFTDPIFVHLETFFKAQDFTVTIADFGEGRVAFYAVRGKATTLFNVHLDTVPVSSGWQYDPFKLTENEGKYYGRGVCDIKGAAACLMALAEASRQDMAVVFTTDEEGTDSCCVNAFIKGHDLSIYEQVVVAEPTGCLAVIAHRGYVSAHGHFKGLSGHSSTVDALQGNAVHQANQWLMQALSTADQAQSLDNPAGICFNLGTIKGGEKNNMIAEGCDVGFSVRTPAGQSSEQSYQSLTAAIKNTGTWHWSLMAPALPETTGGNAAALKYCEKHQLPLGAPVDFWTEASLFAQAGVPALVLGPGNITQAHTIDEWVAIDQLNTCYQMYAGLLS